MSQTWQVWSLDVCGHSAEECECNCECTFEGGVHDDNCDRHDMCEGFSVNDRCRVGTVEIEGRDDMLAGLIEGGFLKSSVTPAMIDIEWAGEGDWYVNDAEDGRPIFQLEAI